MNFRIIQYNNWSIIFVTKALRKHLISHEIIENDDDDKFMNNLTCDIFINSIDRQNASTFKPRQILLDCESDI